ncbi:MAG: phage head-tail connector protein [Pseudomonadota bacterium]
MTTTLISLDDLKTDLGITGTDKDTELNRFASIASVAVEKHLGFPIERTTSTYSTYERDKVRSITIPFFPVHAITRLVVDGRTWLDTGSDPAIEPRAGFGFTKTGILRAPRYCHFCGDIEIDLESGFYLADDAGPPPVVRDLPIAFESAVSGIVRYMLSDRDRDPNVKTESVPGVYTVTFDGSGPRPVGLPEESKRALEPYQLRGLG